MLMMMCPNCRHRFSVPGCCNFGPQIDSSMPQTYNNTNGCFINAPTIINGPTIIQNNPQNGFTQFHAWREEEDNAIRLSTYPSSTDYQMNTTCDLTGGTVTITTPGIQSGGFFLQTCDSSMFTAAPRIEIRPKLSGGNCLIRKKLSSEVDSSSTLSNESIFYDSYAEDLTNVRYFEENPLNNDDETEEMLLTSPPSGCQELPGIRRNSTVKMSENHLSYGQQHQQQQQHQQHQSRVVNDAQTSNQKQKSSCCCNNKSTGNSPSTSTSFKPKNCSNNCNCTSDNSVQIQLNATVSIPPNAGQCTVNITATTNSRLDAGGTSITISKSTNNFNGGGLVQMDVNPRERQEPNAPTSPVSWTMPFLYEFDTSPKDQAKLVEIKRLLNNSGWYHEELSWQQSKDLLKNAPIGQWLMRNSSDSRYTFAVSVQTTKGPTSVRVLYAYGKFRLDSDPRLAVAIRSFDCPIKMLEHYTKALDDQRDEVWVDNTGLFFSQIILTQPLVKEVRSLSHLARLVVNKNKLNIKHLPSLMKNYIAEYPYTF